MARNTAQEFATMDEDDRKKLAGTEAGQSAGNELAFDDPRNADRMGRHYASARDEIADPDDRDGDAANLDEAAHRRAVDAQSRQQNSNRNEEGK